ncbi:hypothetical protein AB0283_16470 [Micromonospora vinacea]|uniref:hypothetical protein n=1 Tax=Micromonospora vinacea TaxID=709878 RepID=UPI0034502927
MTVPATSTSPRRRGDSRSSFGASTAIASAIGAFSKKVRRRPAPAIAGAATPAYCDLFLLGLAIAEYGISDTLPSRGRQLAVASPSRYRPSR